MPYLIALVLVAAFTANVVIGALGDAPLVSVVYEMLILLGAATAFSIGILRSEAREKAKKTNNE
jgi:hypothetical protein